MLLAACLFQGPAARGGDDVELRVKAAFLYNFARFVEWPVQAESQPKVEFCVLGHDPLTPILEETVRGKNVNGRVLGVRNVGGADEAAGCHVLFVARGEQKRLRCLLQALAEKPVLTVSDLEGTVRDGGIIQFRLVDQNVRFEVNLDAAARAGLKLSSQLLRVALAVVGRHS